jgi:hypothetical protein
MLELMNMSALEVNARRRTEVLVGTMRASRRGASHERQPIATDELEGDRRSRGGRTALLRRAG